MEPDLLTDVQNTQASERNSWQQTVDEALSTQLLEFLEPIQLGDRQRSQWPSAYTDEAQYVKTSKRALLRLADLQHELYHYSDEGEMLEANTNFSPFSGFSASAPSNLSCHDSSRHGSDASSISFASELDNTNIRSPATPESLPMGEKNSFHMLHSNMSIQTQPLSDLSFIYKDIRTPTTAITFDNSVRPLNRVVTASVSDLPSQSSRAHTQINSTSTHTSSIPEEAQKPRTTTASKDPLNSVDPLAVQSVAPLELIGKNYSKSLGSVATKKSKPVDADQVSCHGKAQELGTTDPKGRTESLVVVKKDSLALISDTGVEAQIADTVNFVESTTPINVKLLHSSTSSSSATASQTISKSNLGMDVNKHTMSTLPKIRRSLIDPPKTNQQVEKIRDLPGIDPLTISTVLPQNKGWATTTYNSWYPTRKSAASSYESPSYRMTDTKVQWNQSEKLRSICQRLQDREQIEVANSLTQYKPPPRLSLPRISMLRIDHPSFEGLFDVAKEVRDDKDAATKDSVDKLEPAKVYHTSTSPFNHRLVYPTQTITVKPKSKPHVSFLLDSNSFDFCQAPGLGLNHK